MNKRTLLRVLSLLLVFSLLTGCGAANNTPAPEDEVLENDFTFHTFPTDFVIEIAGDDSSDEAFEEPQTTDTADLPLTQLPLLFTNVVANSFDPVRYVMIYNPRIHNTSEFLYTGSIGAQVLPAMDKGGLDEPVTELSVSQDILNEDLPQQLEGSRAGLLITPYQVGDTKDFFCYQSSSLNDARILRTFTCRYAGAYCNIWTADTDMSDACIADYADQFDNYIYYNVVNTFGEPRFSKNGGKVNLLYYPMPENIGGCFCMLDLYASDEVSTADIFSYGVNTDHDILHINASFTQYDHMQPYMRSTMAHEFQHLICATNTFSTPNFDVCPTWFNEAMSGYIEEKLYPGVKEGSSGHLSAFIGSDMIRNGQSLYNFATSADDIGVYGSVYLFADYLSNLLGEDIFSRFHNYWRSSYSPTLNLSEALYQSVPYDTYRNVDSTAAFPATVAIDSENDIWLSKIALQFHLAVLAQYSSCPESFANIDPRALLYDQINPAQIEGGGRIIVELQGDTFVVPDDADEGLLYIGLNKDFQPVTALICP